MYILKSFYFVFVVVIIAAACKGQAFSYKRVPSDYIPRLDQQYTTDVKHLQDSAVDLTNFLPKNYVLDGTVDYTNELQKGINLNSVVLMPNFPIMTSGIYLNTGSTVIFRDSSSLLMVPSSQAWYQVIGINNVHDVKVYFPRIKGDRIRHIGTKGEWGFGIAITNSKNVRIIQPIISNCWGDGIYINDLAKNQESGNIFIDGAWLDNNRRNGISIIDGSNISIINSLISNTNGTMPSSGIDIEPNNGNGELKDIMLNNITTYNNAEYGILTVLVGFVSVSKKNVGIEISNCIDDGSNYGMGYFFDLPNRKFINAGGEIDVLNPIWKNSRSSGLKLPVYSSNNKIVLKFQNALIIKDGKKHVFSDRNLQKNTEQIIFN